MRARLLLSAFVPALVLAGAPSLRAQGQIIIINANGPDVGFNDPTVVAPVGGNMGTTLGQQRLNVFERAADIWEDALHPRVDILVQAQFTALAAGVLGSAGPAYGSRNFPGAELPDTWYHAALANHLAGLDNDTTQPEINANFSTVVNFYLGYDNAEGPGQSDLLPVVLHELGHGLGFSNLVNETTGTQLLGGPDTYSQYTLDVTTDKVWNQMTDAERQTSALNIRHVSWNGVNVNAHVPDVLEPGEPFVGVNGVTGVGPFMFGPSSFGGQISPPGLTGDVVLADDGAAPGADACTPLVNVVAGKIVLMDRGTCNFTVKVKNAQDAGAVAVIVADNQAGAPPQSLGGVDPTVTIPSGRVTLADGNALKAVLAGGSLNVTLGLDLSIIAGVDRVRGLLMVAAFNPVIPGSSISHWDPVAFPNLLMEPSINADLTSSVGLPEDLTLAQMTDIGWFSDGDGVADGTDSCLHSDLRPTVVIESCDSRAPNMVLATGCSVGDLAAQCAAENPGVLRYLGCMNRLGRDLKEDGVITARQRLAIQLCAIRAQRP